DSEPSELGGVMEEDGGNDSEEDDDEYDDDDNMESEIEQRNDQAALYDIFHALVADNDLEDFIRDSAVNDELQQPSEPPRSFLEFPILYFSDTDMRLLPNPFSVRPSLVCR